MPIWHLDCRREGVPGGQETHWSQGLQHEANHWVVRQGCGERRQRRALGRQWSRFGSQSADQCESCFGIGQQWGILFAAWARSGRHCEASPTRKRLWFQGRTQPRGELRASEYMRQLKILREISDRLQPRPGAHLERVRGVQGLLWEILAQAKQRFWFTN